MSNRQFFNQSSLKDIICKHKDNGSTGIYSVCSANRFVLEAAMKEAKRDGSALLVESTSNQVNQFGGYTGMNPGQFVAYIKKVATETGFPLSQLILGGDHLGPNAWQNEDASKAMVKACQMVQAYVATGYEKIHLDTSMRCANDPGGQNTPLDEEVVADRAAALCLAAEETYNARANHAHTLPPLYVIGTEVPIPGGAQEMEETVPVTTPEAAARTIEVTKKAFYNLGLQSAWERVIAVVVQPGVEFGDEVVFPYHSEKARALSRLIESYEGIVFEAHSTDYQTRQALTELVRDHFAVLKVGPALTFAFREAVFALEMMEIEWLTGRADVNLSGLRNVLEKTMLDEPGYWQKHYHGDERYLQYARKYSYSDRSRYYWLHPDVNRALVALLDNLKRAPVPLTLLDQFMPQQYQAVMAEEIANDPVELIHHKIMEVISMYAVACGNKVSA